MHAVPKAGHGPFGYEGLFPLEHRPDRLIGLASQTSSLGLTPNDQSMGRVVVTKPALKLDYGCQD